MTRPVRPLHALLALVVALGSACAHAGSTSRAPSAPAALEPVSPSVFLWHATRAGKPGEVWLLGSVHLRASEDAQLDQAIVEQVTRCERVAFELDFEKEDMGEVAAMMMREGRLPAGQTLQSVVAPETWAKVQSLLSELKLGQGLVENFQPWFAGIMLQFAYYEQQGMAGDQGVDRAVQTFARREPSRTREVIALETAREQLDLLRSSMEGDADAMLASTVDDIRAGKPLTLLELYHDGDERGLSAFLDAARAESPEAEAFMRKLLDERNERMAQKLAPQFDAPGCTFVTVGAGHILGQRGLVRLLRDAGANLESVPGKGPAAPALQALAVPLSEPLVAADEGFSVDLGGKYTRQEVPGPGGVKVRVFVAGDSTRKALTVSVFDLPGELPPEQARALLAASLPGALAQAQLRGAPPSDCTLGGAPALCASGDGDPAGSVGQGHIVGAVRGTKFVMVNALAIQRDPENFAQVKAHFDAVVQSFRWLDVPQGR